MKLFSFSCVFKKHVSVCSVSLKPALVKSSEVPEICLIHLQLREKFVEIRNRLSYLSNCQAIIMGEPYDLQPVTDILHVIDKRQELWRYCDVSSHTIREWLQTVFKKVTLAVGVHLANTVFSIYALVSVLAGNHLGFLR